MCVVHFVVRKYRTRMYVHLEKGNEMESLARCWIIRFSEWRQGAICQCCSAKSPKLCLQGSRKIKTTFQLIPRPPARFPNFRRTRRNLPHLRWLPNRVTPNCRKVCAKTRRPASFVWPFAAEENAVSTRVIAGPRRIWPSMDFTLTGESSF